MEAFLWPILLASILYIVYKVSDFLRCMLFVSLTVEELGSFMEVIMEILKEHVWNKNWIIGGLSMTKVTAALIKYKKESELLALDSGFYIGRYRSKWIFVTVIDKQLNGFGDWVPRHPLIKIHTMRWNQKILLEFIQQAKQEEKPIDNFATGFHSQHIQGRKRSGFNGIFLPSGMKEEIKSQVEWFCSKEGEAWYRAIHQPYKLVYLFHGSAGSGKTALARAIADVTQRSLTHVRLLSTRENLDISHETVSFVAACHNDVILFDEIDKIFIKDCTGNKVDPGTLLGLLNGDLLHGQIIILTANNLEAIPEEFRFSFLRCRRIDRIYEFTHPTEEQKQEACEYYSVAYDNEIAIKQSMADVMDCIMRRLRQPVGVGALHIVRANNDRNATERVAV